MNTDDQLAKSPMWQWPSWMMGRMPNPLDFFAAPQNLAQSILPGWVFGSQINVTEQNSSAPDTEREIVAAQSYGRQLGRVIDTLTALIAELPKAKREAGAFAALTELHDQIDEIKSRSATRRLARIATDLATLKRTQPDEYDRVAAELREALGES